MHGVLLGCRTSVPARDRTPGADARTCPPAVAGIEVTALSA
ncbi:hypothetical protein RAJCM14343_1967 [Rhodococcus aetherivorans]|uniref:Uncharacterized protein n=1 Tax=Rhodococcus aetherivorans TaxID=191292 RepID=A0ABQ0YJI8_9NOCA|nr:hypothetical protein RAJCM14343_1967 [Rhodococcus aetherivorans]